MLYLRGDTSCQIPTWQYDDERSSWAIPSLSSYCRFATLDGIVCRPFRLSSLSCKRYTASLVYSFLLDQTPSGPRGTRVWSSYVPTVSMSPGTSYNPSLIRMLDIAIRGGLFWIYNITCQPGKQCSTTGLISFLILQIVQSIPYPGSFVLVLKAPLRSRWMLFICQSIFRLVRKMRHVWGFYLWCLDPYWSLLGCPTVIVSSIWAISDEWMLSLLFVEP